MKMLKKFIPLSLSKTFLLLMISFIVGILLGGIFKINLFSNYVLLGQVILLFFIGVLFNSYYILKLISIVFIFIFVGIFYYGWYLNTETPKNIPYNQEVEFTGVVNKEAEIKNEKTKLIVLVTESKTTEIIDQQILVNVPRYPEYDYGDKIIFKGILQKPEIFNGFDYGEYLMRYDVFIVLQKSETEFVSSNNGNKLYQAIYYCKSKFESAVEKNIAEPMAALMNGLLIGSRENIPSWLLTIFSIVGITHIIAISGYNVTIITEIFQKLTISWSRTLSLILGVVGIFLFVILTGASASVTRAGIIALLFLFARHIGRKSNIIIALVFVGFIMIVINPLILRFDVGFQLSFLAMAGLIYITPIFEKIFKSLNKFVREPLSATLGAELMTLPILLFNFGKLSIVAPIVNSLILPIIPITMFFGFLTGLTGMIYSKAGLLFGFISSILLKYIIFVSECFSKIPFSSVEIKFNNSIFIIVIYLVLMIVVRKLYKKLKI